MRFIKTLFHQLPGGALEETPALQVNPPLHYIDVDETGALFVRLVHATSFTGIQLRDAGYPQ